MAVRSVAREHHGVMPRGVDQLSGGDRDTVQSGRELAATLLGDAESLMLVAVERREPGVAHRHWEVVRHAGPSDATSEVDA